MKRYLSVDDIIAIHKYLINEFGGAHGLLEKTPLNQQLCALNPGIIKLS